MDRRLDMVTVGGLPGSGTTTVCALLTRDLGWTHINAGQIFRQLAAEAGLTLTDYGRQAERDPSIDTALDERMVAAAREHGRVVLEGRLTGWMALRYQLPALRTWLQAPLAVRAERVGSRDGQDGHSALAEMRERERSEAVRYRAIHGIDLTDLSPYDLVIDTVRHDQEQAAAAILARLREARQ